MKIFLVNCEYALVKLNLEYAAIGCSWVFTKYGLSMLKSGDFILNLFITSV
jgi:hypothetical protein